MTNTDHSGIDRLFTDPQRTAPFRFDDDVAAVFDNMIRRSVPYYDPLQQLLVGMVGAYASPTAHVLDVGCSSGTTLCAMARAYPHLTGRGIDSSAPLVTQARAKAQALGLGDRLQFEVGCLTTWSPPPADVVVASLVLQFIAINERLPLLRRLRQGLSSDGVLLVIEKTIPEHPQHHDRYEQIYHDMKQAQGYSQVEIQTKKKALEGVLMPLTQSDNVTLFQNAGFVSEPFFTWMVFSGWILTPC